jgi:hypothetical protein
MTNKSSFQETDSFKSKSNRKNRLFNALFVVKIIVLMSSTGLVCCCNRPQLYIVYFIKNIFEIYYITSKSMFQTLVVMQQGIEIYTDWFQHYSR